MRAKDAFPRQQVPPGIAIDAEESEQQHERTAHQDDAQ
jgi:hypothetical protein